MQSEHEESVAERYDRIRQELREAVEREEAALDRRLRAAVEQKSAKKPSWWSGFLSIFK